MLTPLFIIIALVVGIVLGYLGARKSMSDTQLMYQQQIEEIRKSAQINAAQQKELFQQQLETVRHELTGQTERLLRERSQQLTDENKNQLSAVIAPLREGLDEMKQYVANNNELQLEKIVRLDENIKATLTQTELIGERADRLAAALTGENKTQGNFGELRLRTLLESMGLQEGLQFEEQTTLRDAQGKVTRHSETGKKLIPDVILHFPDKRDVIIDSKVSLKAFEDYYNATNEDEKSEALQRHITSVRAHVKELSQKNYAQHGAAGRQQLDFVVMYLFSESALSLALNAEPTLWKEAYDKGVFITSSQNLYALLRMLEMSWTQQRQMENQHKIVNLANTIVSRVQLFYQRFVEVEEAFGKVLDNFENTKKLLSPSGHSIINAANSLVQLGAKEDAKRKKTLPKAQETLAPTEETEEDNPTAQLQRESAYPSPNNKDESADHADGARSQGEEGYEDETGIEDTTFNTAMEDDDEPLFTITSPTPQQ